MPKRGGQTGPHRANRKSFPYEPRLVGGKMMMPSDLQRLHRFMLETDVVDVISDEARGGQGCVARVDIQATAQTWPMIKFRATHNSADVWAMRQR
jgi:hypothetical protein